MKYTLLFRFLQFFFLFGLLILGYELLVTSALWRKRLSSRHDRAQVNRGITPRPNVSRKLSTSDAALAKLIPDGNSLPNYFLRKDLRDESVYRNLTITFVHYPKGGGTTVKTCLNEIAQKKGLRLPTVVFAGNDADVKEQILNTTLETGRIFMGTYGFSMCEYVEPGNCAYFTILREPYERVISHYFFCKDGGGSNVDCDRSIVEFALATGSIFLNQLTSRHDCVQSDPDLKWSCGKRLTVGDDVRGNASSFDALVDLVEMKLEDMFAVVGVLDHFSQSMGLLQEAFGLPFYDECLAVHENGDRSNKTEERALEKMTAMKTLMENEDVAKVLAPDIRLYRKVKQIFEKQKEQSVMKLWLK